MTNTFRHGHIKLTTGCNADLSKPCEQGQSRALCPMRGIPPTAVNADRALAIVKPEHL